MMTSGTLFVINQRSEENQDILFRFMRRGEMGYNLFWPEKKEECWIPFIHVLTLVLFLLSLTECDGNINKFPAGDIKKVEACFK